MKIQSKLRLSKIESYTNEKNEKMYRVKFLDEDDESYTFFFNEEQAQKFINAKKYQEFDVTLSLYKSNKGRYNIYLG